MYCPDAADMVLLRFCGMTGGAPVMVWLRPAARGSAPKTFLKAALRCSSVEGPILGGPWAYSRPCWGWYWAMLRWCRSSVGE